MEHTWLLHNLIVALGLLEECSAFPIHLGAGGIWSAGVASPLTPIALGAATLLAALVLLMGCVCCRQQKGFQEFTDSVSSQNNLESAAPHGSGHSHRAASELTLFPPLGTTLNQPGDRSSVVQFEPLPDIHVVAAAAAAARRKPAAFGNTLHHGLSVHDWFEGSVENFPRQQLQYLRELGRGWFGRVVEGKAKEIIPGHATSKVIVKILHEDATPTDQSYFLHEAKPYKTLKHPNVLRLIGRCLETHPFLLLLEDCSSGTLKTFLAENRTNAEKFCEQGVLLEMACGVAAGLHHMVENGFVHTDLAARNCLVSSDLTVKVGDYGTNIETFKDEYYCVSDLAIPIRWVAPETLHCTDTTIETKEVTASANVWSLSIVLWEICEFGKLPYTNLSDDEVIEQVLGKCSTNLPFPTYENQPHVHNLYHLMKICWVEAEKRPPLWRVAAMLKHLVQHKSSPAHTSANNNNNSTTSLDDFERRWELSKPNTVPKIDNQVGTTSMQTSPVKSVLLQRCASLEDNSASTAPHLELNTATDKSRTTASANSPQLSVSSSCTGDGFIPSPLDALKSPSLQNLRGSVDELYNSESKEGAHDIKNRQAPETVAEEGDFDSWLKGMDTSTEEDVRFVRNISEAIRDLDEVLAQEKTSSSSQNSSAQPSPSQITSRDSKPESTIFTSQDQKFTLDFRLGQAAASSFISHNIGLLHSHGHESLSLSQHCLESSGSDTEDETWRIRIERGEFSEKVKEKSRSVADLMVLTHIDYSDGSDSDTTLDLDSCGSTFRKNGAGRRSFNRKPLQSSSSITYGSEGNIHQAVLGEEFQETIKKLQESLRDGSKLEAIPDVSLSCISMSSNDAHDNVPQAQFPLDQSHFLAKLASENKMMKNDGSRATLSVALNTKLDEEQNNFKTEESNTSSENGESKEKLETPLNGDAYFASSGITSVTSHPLETILNYSEDREPSKEGSLKEGKEEISNINGHCNSISGEKFLIASTPISRESNSIRHSDIDTFDMDSSLLCSQSLSLIESEKSDSIVCSPANRPPSPTPDDIETKNESSSCVILGPFEDSTLDYFKGLKTAFPVMKTLNYDTTNEMDLEENSIETWDKFLDHAMQPENCDYPSFSDVSFQKLESESQGSDSNAPSASSDILGSSFERSLPEKLTVGSPVPHLDVKLSEFPAFNGHQPQGDASESGDGKEAEIGLESQVSACAVSTNKVLDPASLVVPSVNVIAATPITSGRNTPNDLTNSDIDSVSSVTKEYPDVTGCLEDNIISDIKIVSEDSEKVYQNLKDSFSQNQFAVPEIKMSGGNTPKFDPDLPCCNLSDRDFVSDDKRFDLQNSAFDIFPTSVDGTPNGNFVEVLETGCYTSSSLDGELTDKGFKPVIPLFSKTFDSKEDANGEILEDDDDFGLGVAKNLTPDDERSSDSGFRDKGSLSESCEDACDEKYNLEDIEAELEEAFSKGVFARQDSPTSNKGVESDCEAVDESFSVTLTDVEKQRELREAEINQSRDPCHRLDDLLRCDQMHEPLSVDVESSVDFFGTSPALSPIPQSSGWYLHPPQVNEETHAEPISGNDSSYFSFNLDEEFVNAIRNELREKLPCAQMQREEHQPQLSDEEDNSDELDSDDSPSRERTNIMIHYKTYPAPLSPILEERESLCSESFSPLGGCNSSSCSEQLSPVFAVDRSPSNQGDGDVRHMESECPAEVDGDLSDDCGDCGDFDEISEHDALPLDLKFNSPSSLNEVPCSIDLCMNDDGDENDDDDVLIVNTETNEATLLESPKPTGKFSFGNDECDDSIHDDFVPDFLSVAGSYQLPESKLNNVERMRSDLYLGNRPLTLATLPQSSVDIEFEDDNNSMTPDSITCEKSFSERTEDSAVGLALSEVMTPDSLAGETQWTSAQMCDSGFGTIISTVPSSSGPSADSPDRRSSEVESIIIEPDASMGILPPASDKTLIKEDDAVESTEATHSTEDSESSVSVSSHSVIAGPLLPNSGDSKTCATEDHVVLASSDPLTSSDIKKDLKLFIMEEAKFSSSVSSSSPQSLKEMAKNTIKSKCSSTVQTLAFNNEDFLEKSHLISTEKTTHCVPCTANGSQSSTSKIIEDLEFENKNLKQSRLEMHDPLQTLAFSDADVTERNNFPGLGHIVVSSIIAPLTPSDETLIPGTLAFNESPESPRAILSPIFKENDSTEAESHLMSTSFMSADDVYEDHDHFTPDWESGSDGCESETASSSSGEFIWKDGERESSVKAVNAVPDSALSSAPDQQTYNQNTTEFPMSSIMEEEEDEDNSGSSSCTSDSEDDTEFVPSAWDSQATPSRSALRSPEKKVEHKKNVSFKRQRYHCVYEYPRELSDSDGSEFADSPSRRRTWDLENSTYNMHDWDLAVNEGMAETSCQDDTKDEQLSASPSASQKLYEFYKLSSADYGFGSTMLSEDGEFFISSSAQPFHTLGEAGPSGGSEFFPGRDLTVSSVDDGDVVDGPMDHNSVKSGLPTNSENQNWRHTEDFSDSDSSDTNMITASEGSFNQQQSGDSNSSSTPMVTANGSSKSSEDSSIYHSIPSNQELQVDSGSDSPLSELSPTSPLSPSSPSHGLGELRHTRDRLKLDLPAANTTFVLVAPCKRRSVEQVKGEASLLDGEDGLKGSKACVNETLPVSSNVH